MAFVSRPRCSTGSRTSLAGMFVAGVLCARVTEHSTAWRLDLGFWQHPVLCCPSMLTHCAWLATHLYHTSLHCGRVEEPVRFYCNCRRGPSWLLLSHCTSTVTEQCHLHT